MLKNIAIIGSGYVGYSLGVLLSEFNNVVIHDIDESKIKRINNKDPLYLEKNLEKLLTEKKLYLKATSHLFDACDDADLIIIALPTNFNNKSSSFDMDTIEDCLDKIHHKYEKKNILIKSTVQIGFTQRMQIKYPNFEIVFSPEFLREGNAVYDNLYPSRIIISLNKSISKLIASLLGQIAKNNPEVLFMSPDEAESVKLFSNSYLATRISFFNELDSFCIKNSLDVKSIIRGISKDPRIGEGYNNPSFGYGGYCLPKDTKQLNSSYEDIPHEILSSTIQSNISRKKFIANEIINTKKSTIGIYKLVMKKNSDNYRESAVIEIVKYLIQAEKKVLIYEPLVKNSSFLGAEICNDIDLFKNKSELIVANRLSKDISDVGFKLFSRDIFNEN